MNLTYNLEQLVSAKVYDKKEIRFLEFRRAKKFLFFNIKEKFYQADSFFKGWTKEQLENEGDKLIIDNKVYDKPYVLLLFSNDERFKKQFDSLEEAFKWRDLVCENIKLKLTI